MSAKPKYDVFICHSSNDHEFVDKLEAALEKEGRVPWIDQREVRPSEQWLRAIRSGIESSDNFLFVLTTDALTSANCRDELEHALKYNKRVVPVLLREIPKADLPPELSTRHWVDFRNPKKFKQSAESLVEALDLDLDRVREHTRLLTKAIDWQARNNDNSLLLRGKDLMDSENWLTSSDSKHEPMPIALQTQFVLTSRRYQTKRQRFLVLVSIIGLVFAMSLALLFLYQRNVALSQERTANARRLLAQAEILGNEGKGSLALLVSIESMRRLPSLEADQLLRKQLKNLSEPVTQLKFDAPAELIISSPSGRYFAVVRGRRWRNTPAGNTVWVLDAATGNKIKEFKHDDNVNVAAFDRSERYLATASDDRTVRIWDLNTGTEMTRLYQDGGIRSLAFSADGKYLAGCGRKWAEEDIWSENQTVHPIGKPAVFLWEISTRREMACVVRCDQAESIRFDNQQGFLVYSNDFEGRAVRWQVHKGESVVKRGWGQGQSSLSGDGRYVAKDVSINIPDEPVDDEDYTYEIYDLFTHRRIRHISYRGLRPEITLSPDGKYLAIADLSTTSIWDVTKPREALRLTGRQVGTPTAFGSGELVAVRTSDGVSVWDLDTQEEVARIGSDRHLSTVSFNADGSGLITGDSQGIIQLWKMPTGRESFELETSDRADNVWFDGDGRTIRALSLDGALTTWDLESHTKISSSRPYANATDVEFSPDRKFIAVNESNDAIHILNSVAKEVGRFELNPQGSGLFFHIRALSLGATYLAGETAHEPAEEPEISHLDVYDCATGQRISSVTHEGRVWAVIFSRDTTRMVTGGRDGSVRVWNRFNGLLLKRIETGSPVHLLQFTPDDDFLITGGESSGIRVWDTNTWKEAAWLTHNGPVWVITSSSDGRYLALGGKDGVVRVWDMDSKKQTLELKHDGDVRFLAFSADNRYILTTRGYNTARVWEVLTGREISRFERDNSFHAVDISPNGRYLATSCCNRILVESLWSADLIDAACIRSVRNLTPEEWRDYMGNETYTKTCPALP